MDINNVKLDWGPILEGQIKHLESTYPDIPIRKSFVPLVESLNSNRIKSRVILSGINVSAYAFVTPSSEHTDRSYATVGFTDPKLVNEERVDTLIKWLEDHARIQNQYLMLNEIYNAEGDSDNLLIKRGYKKFVRKRLTLDLGDYVPETAPLSGEYLEIPINKVDYDNYSDAEFNAFSGTPDQILFNSSKRKERIEFSKSILQGKVGKVIAPATKIIASSGSIVAATIATEYRTLDDARTALLADIFVDKKLRGKGIAKHLLFHTLSHLKLNGYELCALWVSQENPAMKLYEKFGFNESGTSEIFYYRKP